MYGSPEHSDHTFPQPLLVHSDTGPRHYNPQRLIQIDYNRKEGSQVQYSSHNNHSVGQEGNMFQLNFISHWKWKIFSHFLFITLYYLLPFGLHEHLQVLFGNSRKVKESQILSIYCFWYTPHALSCELKSPGVFEKRSITLLTTYLTQKFFLSSPWNGDVTEWIETDTGKYTLAIGELFSYQAFITSLSSHIWFAVTEASLMMANAGKWTIQMAFTDLKGIKRDNKRKIYWNTWVSDTN